MPCPLFLSDTSCCAADPTAAIDKDKLGIFCRRGYARAVCPHAAAIEADATALLIRSDHDGVIEVAWSMERNHHPLAVGIVSVIAGRAAASTLERQACALAAEYERRLER